ncbi:hypothetical protein ACP4OV_003127 [Aristida adscensionis]
MDLALYKAATQGDVARLRQLVAADPSILVRSKTPDGKTALHIAALRGYTDFAGEVLGAAGELLVAVNADGDTPLHLAAREGQLKVAKLLVDRARAPAPTGAVGADDVETATISPNPLAATNRAGDTPLHEAVRHRRIRVARWLLGADADPGRGHALNQRMETPLHIAAREGLVDVVNKIVSSGQWPADPEEPSTFTNGTALHQAALGGHIQIMEILMEKRPQLIEETDSDGNNALHYAAQNNHKRAAHILLEQRRELATQGNRVRQQSPLHVAAHHGSTGAMRELLRHCPDLPEMVDVDRRNAFHTAAAAAGRMDSHSLRCLLRHARLRQQKELLNRGDRVGDTPLHLAAGMSHVHSAMLLLGDDGVDPCVLNGAGKTPRDVLEERGFDELDSLDLYVWRELKKKEASRRPGRSPPPSFADRHRGASGGESGDYFERRIETYLLVAALVTTVTFAATFTMPGGYNQTDGTAIHSHRMAFKVFVVSNTVAMSSSSVVLLCFLWAWKDPMKSKLDHLIWGHRLTILACLAMLVSLMAAVYVTVAPPVRWPVYTAMLIGISVPVIAGFILGKEILYVPL